MPITGPAGGSPRSIHVVGFLRVHAEEVNSRLGFNIEGADRFDGLNCKPWPAMPVGLIIGKWKSTPLEDTVDGYLYTYKRFVNAGDYSVVYIPSPNSRGCGRCRAVSHSSGFTRSKSAGAKPLLVTLLPAISDSAVENALAVVNSDAVFLNWER